MTRTILTFNLSPEKERKQIVIIVILWLTETITVEILDNAHIEKAKDKRTYICS